MAEQATTNVASLGIDTGPMAQAVGESGRLLKQVETNVRQSSQATQQSASSTQQSLQQMAQAIQAMATKIENDIGRETKAVKKSADDEVSAFKKIEENAEKFNEKVAGPFRTVHNILEGYLVLRAFEFLKEGIEKVVDATSELEQSQHRLQGVLTATDERVGLTAEHLNEIAEQSSGKTLFNDNDFRNAEAALLTFDKVHGETFERAIKDAADLASVYGGDLTGATRALGRALEDPVLGMQLLRREGVMLNEADQQHIKTLADQGKQYEAQEALLTAVEGKTHGLAETMHQGLAGATHDAGVAWDHFLESVGKTDIVGGNVEKVILGWSYLLTNLAKQWGMTTSSMEDLADVEKKIRDEQKTISLAESTGADKAFLESHKATLAQLLAQANDITRDIGKQAEVRQAQDDAAAAHARLVRYRDAEDTIARLSMTADAYQAWEKTRAEVSKDARRFSEDETRAEELLANTRLKGAETAKQQQSALRDLLKSYEDEAARLQYGDAAVEAHKLAEVQQIGVIRQVTAAEVDAARLRVAVLRDEIQVRKEHDEAMKSVAKTNEEQQKRFTDGLKEDDDKLRQLRDSLDDERAKLTLSAAAYEQYKVERALAGKTPPVTDPEQLRKLAAEVGILRDAAEAHKKLEELAKEWAKQEDDAAKVYEEVWKHAATQASDDIKSTLTQAFEGQITSARDFAGELLKLMSKLFADIAATYITSGLAGIFSNLFGLGQQDTGLGDQIVNAIITSAGSLPGVGVTPSGATVPAAHGPSGARLAIPARLSPSRGGSVELPLAPTADRGSAASTIINVQQEHHWTVQALDAPGVVTLLQRNSGAIQGIILQGVRDSRAYAQALTGVAGR